LADAKRSAMKLKQRLADVRAKNAAVETRMMMMLGHVSTSPGCKSSAGGDCSGHSSSDDSPADHQQVSPLHPYYQSERKGKWRPY